MRDLNVGAGFIAPSMPWINEIKAEDLPERYKELVAALNEKLPGVPAVSVAIIVAERFGGLVNFYLPKLNSILKKIRDEKILQDFNGHNYRELRYKYNLCDTQIRKIVRGQKAA
jgi:Mor family transcriptional regulator